MLTLSQFKAAQSIREAVGSCIPSRRYFSTPETPREAEVTAPGLIEIIDPKTGQPLLIYPDENPYMPSADNNSYSPNRTS